MQYIPRERYQHVCKGFNQNGELIWELEFKQAWHTRMFPVRYKGDFQEQWMWLILKEQGFDWDLMGEAA